MHRKYETLVFSFTSACCHFERPERKAQSWHNFAHFFAPTRPGAPAKPVTAAAATPSPRAAAARRRSSRVIKGEVRGAGMGAGLVVIST